jgi:hypothetical protein
MGEAEDELNLIKSTKYYQLLFLSHFEFLLQNLQYVSSYMLLVMSLFYFFVVLIEIVYIYETTD